MAPGNPPAGVAGGTITIILNTTIEVRMSNFNNSNDPTLPSDLGRVVSRRLKLVVTIVVAVLLVAIVWVVTTSPNSGPATSTSFPTAAQYSAGVVNASKTSGLGPLSATSIPGYVQSYVTEFTGSSLPPGWHTFSGKPGGDPTGQFSPAHVTVSNGLLQLNAWKDPQFHNMWVTGGLCLCGKPQTYGAFFIRSRQTGSGPNEVELLWPEDNSWPPEIDFNETGGRSFETSATVHWAIANHQIQYLIAADLTTWHTWGVIWTPKEIDYTLDGHVWATDTVSATIPGLPMSIDIEQRTVCDPTTQCPVRPTSLLVEWVEAFSPSTSVG